MNRHSISLLTSIALHPKPTQSTLTPRSLSSSWEIYPRPEIEGATAWPRLRFILKSIRARNPQMPTGPAVSWGKLGKRRFWARAGQGGLQSRSLREARTVRRRTRKREPRAFFPRLQRSMKREKKRLTRKIALRPLGTAKLHRRPRPLSGRQCGSGPGPGQRMRHSPSSAPGPLPSLFPAGLGRRRRWRRRGDVRALGAAPVTDGAGAAGRRRSPAAERASERANEQRLQGLGSEKEKEGSAWARARETASAGLGLERRNG